MMDKPDYYTVDLWFTNWRMEEEVAGREQMGVMERLRSLLKDPSLPQLHSLAEDVWSSAQKRGAHARNVEDQMVTLWGGTWKQVEKIRVMAAERWGVKLLCAPGALLRGTRAAKVGARRQWSHAPLSTGQAGKVASHLFRQVAAHSYVRSGNMSGVQAWARVLKEKWVSHGGRRGFTTEVLALLAWYRSKYRSKHPAKVADDSEHLLNIHAGWVSDEATTQEHYTGMRPLDQLLLLTWLC